MENIIFIILMGGCGLLFLYLGYLIWIKQKITIIHDYHHTKVAEKDKKAYTGIMGKAMLVIGVGLLVSGAVGFFVDDAKCIIPLAVLGIAGLAMMVYAQVKYNRGIF